MGDQDTTRVAVDEMDPVLGIKSTQYTFGKGPRASISYDGVPTFDTRDIKYLKTKSERIGREVMVRDNARRIAGIERAGQLDLTQSWNVAWDTSRRYCEERMLSAMVKILATKDASYRNDVYRELRGLLQPFELESGLSELSVAETTAIEARITK